MTTTHYTIEALIVGIITVIIGLAVSASIIIALKGKFSEQKNYPKSQDWMWMAVGLFLTGFVAHMLLEVLKLNLWYCQYGYACVHR